MKGNTTTVVCLLKIKNSILFGKKIFLMLIILGLMTISWSWDWGEWVIPLWLNSISEQNVLFYNKKTNFLILNKFYRIFTMAMIINNIIITLRMHITTKILLKQIKYQFLRKKNIIGSIKPNMHWGSLVQHSLSGCLHGNRTQNLLLEPPHISKPKLMDPCTVVSQRRNG